MGTTNRGQFRPGPVRVKDQAERAACRSFKRGALRHPNIVNCHWFSYCDEPITGRTLDGENYQNGFVDVADTPYTKVTILGGRAMQEYHALLRGA